MATDIAQAAAARQQKQQVKQVISSEEMAASIKAASEKRSYDFMVKLKGEIKEMLDQSGLQLERAFRAFDTDRDGSVDIFELTQGLQSLAPGVLPCCTWLGHARLSHAPTTSQCKCHGCTLVWGGIAPPNAPL